MPWTRRLFLRRSLAGGAALLVACGEGAEDATDGGLSLLDGGLPDAADGDGPTFDAGVVEDGGALGDGALDAAPDMMVVDCADPFEGGELLEILDFASGDQPTFHRSLGQGWDGRLYFDLRQVDEDALLTPTEQFFVRTFYPDPLDPDRAGEWTIEIEGLVDAPVSLAVADLEPRDMGAFVLECSGNGDFSQFGLLSAATWQGVPLSEVLADVGVLPDAVAVKISGFDEHDVPSRNGHSTPGAAWVIPLDQVEATGAFLATGMNGEALPPDHGLPVRLYVPNWYGCACIKWVDTITLVGADEPATGQMIEFATRTHQPRPAPALARDFLPPSMDQAAMPVRVERWQVDGETLFRVVGIAWGGYAVTDALEIRFNPDEAWQPVDVCPPMRSNQPWTVWEHVWQPAGPGLYQVRCRVADDAVPTQRLDVGFYDRVVRVGG